MMLRSTEGNLIKFLKKERRKTESSAKKGKKAHGILAYSFCPITTGKRKLEQIYHENAN